MLYLLNIECNFSSYLDTVNYTNRKIIQCLSGSPKYIIPNEYKNDTILFSYKHSNQYGNSVATRVQLFKGSLCDIKPYLKTPKFYHYFAVLYLASSLTREDVRSLFLPVFEQRVLCLYFSWLDMFMLV